MQFEGESLDAYVQCIRNTNLVLRISENKAHVVERIIDGLTPT